MNIKLAEDGSAEIRIELRARGDFAVYLRSNYEIAAQRQTLLEKNLGRTFAGAKVLSQNFSDLSNLDEGSADVIATPFGDVPVASGLLDGTPVLVLRRHGAVHAVPPHRIDYRANVQAIRDAGATTAVATAAERSASG